MTVQMYQFLVLIVLIIALANSLSIKSASTTSSDHIRLIFPKDRNSSETRIYGGTEASPNDFSYQAGMYIVKGDGLSFCGGSLIAQDVLLTAAHCVNNAVEIYVFYGHHNTPDYKNILNGNEQNVLKSTNFRVHEDFNETIFINDVALVYLPEKVTSTEHIQIVPLDIGTDKHVGEEATVSGWGITFFGDSFQMGRGLKYVENKIISNDECKTFSTLNSVIKNSHICLSNENNKGVCSGDSGGPLVIDGVQIGIVSFGASTCTPIIPSVFTRVSSLRDWIDINTDEDHKPTEEPIEKTTKASSGAATTFNPNYFSFLLMVGLMKTYSL